MLIKIENRDFFFFWGGGGGGGGSRRGCPVESFYTLKSVAL